MWETTADVADSIRNDIFIKALTCNISRKIGPGREHHLNHSVCQHTTHAERKRGTLCNVFYTVCETDSFGVTSILGRAIAQAVSRWLPTAAVRGSRPGRRVGFCGQSGAGEGFLRVLRFPLPNSFHQLLQKIIFIIINQSSGRCTIGQMDKRLWPQCKGLTDT
jgi:hypothetical protein